MPKRIEESAEDELCNEQFRSGVPNKHYQRSLLHPYLSCILGWFRLWRSSNRRRFNTGGRSGCGMDIIGLPVDGQEHTKDKHESYKPQEPRCGLTFLA